MNPRFAPLRASLLAAAGLAGCSTASTAGDPKPVDVTIPPASSTASAPPIGTSTPSSSSKTGYVKEANGTFHRVSAASCTTTIDEPACTGTEKAPNCKTDADCTEHPNGKCISGQGQIGTYCGCRYSCASDADCTAGQACVCAEAVAPGTKQSVCAPALCRADSDCGGKTCAVSEYFNGCGRTIGLACHTPEDKCQTDSDCPEGRECAVRSIAPVPGRPPPTWDCQTRSCVVGRPLVVDGRAHAASPRARTDWDPASAALEPIVPADSALRDALASHWAEAAALEHASIASFARFTLELLALGAPSHLVADAHRAGLDEIEHARIAYGLASRFAGRAIGPGSLAAATASIDADPAAVAIGVVEEGCVGETLGVAEALELAHAVTDPALAAVYARLAADELRHAELAWRALRWLTDTFGATVREAAAGAFDRAFAQFSQDPPHAVCSEDAAGLLSSSSIGALRRQVLRDVIEPARAAAFT